MTQGARQNNKSYIRGRFVRDPAFTTAKNDPSRQMAFGRVAVDSPFVDGNGDARTRTDYFEVKVFNGDVAEKLKSEGAVKGCLVEVNGAVSGERQEYTDSETGEVKVAYNVVLTVENTEGHSVTIESFPSNRNAQEQAQA